MSMKDVLAKRCIYIDWAELSCFFQAVVGVVVFDAVEREEHMGPTNAIDPATTYP